MYRSFGKRALDVVVAGVALTLLAPVILLTALVIRVALGAPVLFRQTRPGRFGRPFAVFKFRTMRTPTGPGETDDDRMTAVGRFVRSLSLDELPELLNVLKGDMSLVGPRPLLMQYLARYTSDQARRHEVRPGITGLAQVNGRNLLSWEDKFQFDVSYVNRCSLWLDLEILARTPWKLVAREGVSQPGHATTTEFLGSSQR